MVVDKETVLKSVTPWGFPPCEGRGKFFNFFSSGNSSVFYDTAIYDRMYGSVGIQGFFAGHKNGRSSVEGDCPQRGVDQLFQRGVLPHPHTRLALRW